MKKETIAQFAQSLRGHVIGRDHPEYDEARKLYNAITDKRPLLIARCADAGDVMAAVNFGRENGLPIAVRGGGHNGPGLGSVDDGLVIDLSMMKGVRVDPKNRTVRVGAGCTTGDVDHATQAFGQAVPFGVVSTTRVAGLTRSGGHGYLSRQYGLAVDNLLEADVVLADGRFVTASRVREFGSVLGASSRHRVLLVDRMRWAYWMRPWTSEFGCGAWVSVDMRPRSATTRSARTFCPI